MKRFFVSAIAAAKEYARKLAAFCSALLLSTILTYLVAQLDVVWRPIIFDEYRAVMLALLFGLSFLFFLRPVYSFLGRRDKREGIVLVAGLTLPVIVISANPYGSELYIPFSAALLGYVVSRGSIWVESSGESNSKPNSYSLIVVFAFVLLLLVVFSQLKESVPSAKLLEHIEGLDKKVVGLQSELLKNRDSLQELRNLLQELDATRRIATYFIYSDEPVFSGIANYVLFFEEGEQALSRSSQLRLDVLAKAFSLCRLSSPGTDDERAKAQRPIRITGYSSSSPDPKSPTALIDNLRLADERAMSTSKYLQAAINDSQAVSVHLWLDLIDEDTDSREIFDRMAFDTAAPVSDFSEVSGYLEELGALRRRVEIEMEFSSCILEKMNAKNT